MPVHEAGGGERGKQRRRRPSRGCDKGELTLCAESSPRHGGCISFLCTLSTSCRISAGIGCKEATKQAIGNWCQQCSSARHGRRKLPTPLIGEGWGTCHRNDKRRWRKKIPPVRVRLRPPAEMRLNNVWTRMRGQTLAGPQTCRWSVKNNFWNEGG